MLTYSTLRTNFRQIVADLCVDANLQEAYFEAIVFGWQVIEHELEVGLVEPVAASFWSSSHSL